MYIKSNLKKWFKEEDGATAIEFAFVGLPFTFLLIGIIELSLMFAGSSILEGATNDAARMIRTGQIQQDEGNQEDIFRQALCDGIDVLLNCDNLQYEVIRVDGFYDIENYAAQFDGDGNLASRGFNAGGVSDVVLVRAAYRYPIVTPFFGSIFSDGDNQSRLLMSTIALQSEPYDFEEEGG